MQKPSGLFSLFLVTWVGFFFSACNSIQLNPKHAVAHNNRGLDYQQQGQLEQAIVQYQQAIQLDPKATAIHNNLGNAYSKQGQLEQAIAQYQQAIQLDPKHADAHYNLACVYSLKNERVRAIEWLQKAIAIDKSWWIEQGKTDSDFDNIRQSTEFQRLINSQ